MNGHFELAKKFLSLRPRIGQIANLLKYSVCFATGRFPAHLRYRPITFGAYVTHRCNLNCPFCCRLAADRASTKYDMTVQDFRSLVAHPSLRDAFRVAFMGGEPLLHSDLFTFIELARRHKKLTYVATNGLLVSERLDQFRQSTLGSIQFSLYDGHMDRQVENIHKLRSTNRRISVVLSRIVTSQPESWQTMREIMRIAADVKARDVLFFTYEPLSANDLALCFFDDNTEMREYMDAFAEEFGRNFRIRMPSPVPRKATRPFCVVPYTAPYIGKGGSVSPCCEILPPADEMGNFFVGDFWNNEFFSNLRKNFASRFPVHPRCKYCPASATGKARGFSI